MEWSKVTKKNSTTTQFKSRDSTTSVPFYLSPANPTSKKEQGECIKTTYEPP
jgi:hypothetical protein